ncbi:MAG TPA: hypothetical protein PKD00_04235 [Burkholderiales bacterium]|nr:hypothetical protein [Burkholderiales bacterium]
MKINLYKFIILLFIIVSVKASPLIIGGTFDTMSFNSTPTNTCLLAAKDFKNIDFINPAGYVSFDDPFAEIRIRNVLATEYGGPINYGAFEIAAHSYAKSSFDDPYTMNFHYIYTYSRTAVFKNGSIGGIKSLTPEALKLVTDYPIKFRQMCGDKFIEQIDAGFSVLFRIGLKFDSPIEKDYYNQGFNRMGGLTNIIDRIRKNPYGVNYKLTISAMQAGGDFSKLKQLFLQHNGYISEDGYPELKCKSATDDKSDSECVSMINEIISYANNVYSQLQGPKDYFYWNPVTSSWYSIGIPVEKVEPDEAVLKAMEELTKQYNQDENDSFYVDNYERMLASKGLLSDKMKQDLTNLSNSYHNLLKLYKDPMSNIFDCYSGFVSKSCLTIKDSIFAKREYILSDNRLNQLLIYLRNNQFVADFLVNDDLREHKTCLLSPITDADNLLYMINCNGQASGSFVNDDSIKIIKNTNNTITIKSMVYNYKPYKFNYKFDQPLIVDPFDPICYRGNTVITINNDLENPIKKDFLLVKTHTLDY